MLDLLKSLFEAIKNRVSNPVYGIFAIWTIIFHWRFFVVLFFVSEDKIWLAKSMLKEEYLYRTYSNYGDWTFHFYLLMPFVLTFLTIWVFPQYIFKPAFRRIQKDKTQLKIDKIQEQQRFEIAKTQLTQAEIKNIAVVSEKSQKEKKLEQIDPTLKWEQEYEEFYKSFFYSMFDRIIYSIYDDQGRLSGVPKELLAYCHSNGLIDIIKQSGMSDRISLTEKGKFFVKNFSNKVNTLS